MKIGIFYATGKGDTRSVCEYLANSLGADLKEVKTANKSDFEGYDVLILASSSYGFGELHGDWIEKLPELKAANLKDKKVAIVGVGNQAKHADSFCGGVVDFLGAIKDAVLIGESENNGYKFSKSQAFINGKFIGLMLDTKGDSEYEKRIDQWVSRLKTQI